MVQGNFLRFPKTIYEPYSIKKNIGTPLIMIPLSIYHMGDFKICLETQGKSAENRSKRTTTGANR